MSSDRRHAALARIDENIRTHGFHVYSVRGGRVPRFLYTIGRSDTARPELVLAGLEPAALADAARVVDELSRSSHARATELVRVGDRSFALRPVHPTWVKALMLGACDWYRRPPDALQIVPDDEHRTRDVPDLSSSTGPDGDPVWCWLSRAWPHAVPADADVATTVGALRGAPVTQVARWEDDAWEMLDEHPDPDGLRVVSMATALGIDPTLDVALTLAVGQARRRSPGGSWR